ncbi:RidA family protein [Paraburkholderia sediminicola]|uniref:RidA family protein n=1 Tax=Paraburkholderia sediminicola TaxID=458836 RepID=UPI0038BA36C3
MTTIQLAPVPQGEYKSAIRHGDLIFTAGMTPRRNGVLAFHGKVDQLEGLDSVREAVDLAAENALSAVTSQLKEAETISALVSLTVFLNAREGFESHSRIADLASAFFKRKLGTAGVGPRCSVGVSSLPSNAPVEIQIIATAASCPDGMARAEP